MKRDIKTSGNLIQFCDYRRKKRKAYLCKIRTNFDKFMSDFLNLNFKTDFDAIQSYYLRHQSMQNNFSWDTQDLRDAIMDAITIVYGNFIWEEISKQKWFDPTYISREEVIERCTTEFILASESNPHYGLSPSNDN